MAVRSVALTTLCLMLCLLGQGEVTQTFLRQPGAAVLYGGEWSHIIRPTGELVLAPQPCDVDGPCAMVTDGGWGPPSSDNPDGWLSKQEHYDADHRYLYSSYPQSYTGPAPRQLADLDYDGDVDMADAAILMAAMTGPSP